MPERHTIDVAELLKAGTALGEIEEKDQLLYAIVPEGYQLQVKDLADRNVEVEEQRKMRETGRPVRNRGTVDVADVESFSLMVQREQIPETTVCFADLDREKFEAVINFAEDGKTAGFGDRVIRLRLQQTPEFQRWLERNRSMMNQLQLADFMEQNLESIVEPDAATIIDMIRALKVTKQAEFSSAVDTSTGMVSIAYSEVKRGETQNKDMEFVGRFQVAVSPFRGSKKYKIDCNLRFDTEGNSLVVYYSMVNLSAVVEHAFKAEEERVIREMADLDVPYVRIR